MHLQVRFASAFRVEHGGNLPVRRFPDKGNNVDRITHVAVLDHVPAPVVEPGDLPAQFPPVVEQEHLAQKSADAPIVVFGLIRAHGRLHRLAPHRSSGR